MRKLVLALFAASSLMTVSAHAAPADTAPRTPLTELGKDDPYLWMEEIEGQRALDWAKAQNDRSLPILQNDPRYAGLHASALAIVNAKDRIPGVSFIADADLRNYWQDADHVRGVWRRTSLVSYRTAEPVWETILDLDALAKAEGKNWVWKGADCLAPESRYCLVSLSNGGKDAVVVREYDTVAKTFVEGGFTLPEGKHRIDWLDKDTLIVATDWTPGEVTTSGYPYVVKLVKRGQPLAAAKEIYRGAKDDGGYGVSPFALRDHDGVVQAVFVLRPLDTFNAETHLVVGDKTVKLPFPLKSSIQALVKGQLVFSVEQDWAEQGLKTGDLAAFDLAALKADATKAKATLILHPTARESVQGVTATRDRLVVALFENVKGAAYAYDFKGGAWGRTKLALPANSTVSLGSASDKDDRLFVSVTGYLTPTTYWLADAATGKLDQVKAAPAKFDASTHVVEQFEATSKDGTKIPYFLVRPKGIKYDGSTPTLLYAYGGFQASMTPGYSATTGKLWLERGGAYVVANIRGGGEFGPSWHEQGLKANRQRVYDDFFAVSEDLIARKITSPRRLGVMGGSNGGLLMGVALTQRPELYNAIVIQVPLFDMVRYSQIGAGSSWMGEYGDPQIPSDLAVIEKYSPYQNLKAGQKYPEVFIETSTKDDRVHPAHARKAAAKLEALGYPVLYYENVDGGHAASANLAETARRVSLEYTYLTRKLMD
ncbi:prolyl oligopeptidase family serine peptidase [Caulobacter hibisci]|uniref:S9 family peptidase n=1 Tax=Caulobacter hibisci TaxID=2035993 RepID=A0ABS0SVE9_9CAUL|nr:prolyl oligopeptidase family serine peptidase [Caulobacter hibisci]MBI1683499.1 S9 family peptidase [Caulobacter hibisci]